MEQLFNRKGLDLNDLNSRTKIIYQYPQIKGEKIPDDKKIWLLIPMVAYKVLVPYPKERELNFFQETILKLFLSGNKSAEYISEKLLLDKKLVKYIIEQLQSRKLLSEDGLVTLEGKGILNEGSEQYDLKIGYTFYDLVNKNYSDTFVFDNKFEVLESRFGDTQRRFEYGNVGNPIYQYGQVVKVKDVDIPIEPSNVDILKVCVKHKKRMSSLERSGYYNPDEEIRLPNNLEQVKYLGEAMPVYVATFILLPDDLQNKSYWQICHPFYGGTSIRLRENIELLIHKEENNHIKKKLEQLINNSFLVDKKELNEIDKKKEKEATEFIVSILSENICTYQPVLNKLSNTKRLLNEVDKKKNNKGKNHEGNQKKLGSCLINLHEAMEEAFHILKDRFAGYFDKNIITNDARKNGETLSLIASDCGFVDKNQIFQSMLTLKKGSILYAGAGKSKDLKSLIAINLLIAKEVDSHPFRKLGKKVPLAIRFLNDLLKRRNLNKHTLYEQDEKIQVENTFIRVLFILHILFDDLKFIYDENVSFYREGFNDNDIDNKLRIAAENEVETNIGLEIRTYDILNKILIETSIAKKSYDDDFIVHCSKCLEHLFLIIDRNIIDIKAKSHIKYDIDQHLEYLTNEIKEQGYAFNLDLEQLPESFKRVSTKKIANTFNNIENGVLSTKIYVMLYSALESNNNVILEISKEVPQLIILASEINDKRGHGDSWVFEDSQADYFYRELNNVIKKILPILKRNNMN